MKRQTTVPLTELHLLTIPQAAELLSFSERTIARLIANNELESVLIGKSRRITQAAIRAYVDRQPTSTGPTAA